LKIDIKIKNLKLKILNKIKIIIINMQSEEIVARHYQLKYLTVIEVFNKN